MARPNKPWYWKARKGWYVKIEGTRYPLGPDRDEAFRRYHELMAKGPEQAKPTKSKYINEVLQAFLDWTKQHRSPKTHRGYGDFCDPFNKHYFGLLIEDLTPAHVNEWLGTRTTWNQTTRRNAITCLMRAFNWGVKMGYIDHNPIRGMEKPQAVARTSIVTPDDLNDILSSIADSAFKDLCVVSFDLGCRPQEIKLLEARHVQLDKQRCLIPGTEAKGGKPRAIYIPTERSLTIVRERIELHPEGPIFRNLKGNPWTASAVRLRFQRLETKIGKRFRQYDFRHGFITRKLLAGVDSHVVASLAGHSNTSMIDKVYSHVADDHRFMLNAAKQDIISEDETPGS